MKYVSFVILFFLSFCFTTENASAENIQLDSDVLSGFPWESNSEINIWVKDVLLENARITFWMEEMTIQDHIKDMSVPGLQFTLVISCGETGSPFTLTWMKGNILPSVDFYCNKDNLIQIRPVLEQSLYPLPQEAIEYLAHNSE